MNLKIIIIGTVVTFTLLFGGLFWLSRPATKPEIAAASIGRLTAAETFYDFGSVSMAKGLVAYKFTVTNSDSVPAVVTKLYTSCMCTKAALDISGKIWGPFSMLSGHGGAVPAIAAEIAPGQTGDIEAIFDPAAHGPAGIGKIERQIIIEQNGQPPLSLTIRALVTP